MNFVDKTLIRLADPVERKNVFDQTSLGQLLAAAYHADAMGVTGPYAPVFDELRLGFSLPPLGTLEGALQPVGGGAERTQAEFRIAGIGVDPGPRIDAFWRGAVSAHYADSGEVVEAVETGVQPFPTLQSIDAAIIAAAGSLPSDPVELEDARREQLRVAADAAAPHPGSVTRALLDSWIAATGIDGVAGFLAAAPAAPWVVEELRVAFTAPAGASAAARLLPLAGAMLVRAGQPFSLSDLLTDSKEALGRVAALGLDLPRAAGTQARRGVLVIWVLPDDLFDDPDWPGGTAGSPADKRKARRAAAGAWLAQEGIGLVTA